MSIATRLGLWFLALSLNFGGPAFSQLPPSRSTVDPTQSSAESVVRALVEKYFALYAAKDLDGLRSLWSEKSPDYASLKQNLQQQFATEDSSFGPPTISRLKMESEQASLRVTLTLTAINLKSNQKRQEQLIRNLSFVREGGNWKIWRLIPAVNDLAEALVKVGTEADQAALLAQEEELVTAELVSALSSLGNRSYAQGEYQQALAIYQLTKRIAEEIGDQTGFARVLGNIGNVYVSQGIYAHAMEHYQKSLAASESLRDKAGIARSMNNIGKLHFRQGNFVQALECLQKFLAISEELGEQVWVSTALNNIGTIHNEQSNFGKALECYKKSLAISESLKDTEGIGFALNNIGSIYYRQGDFVRALEYAQKAMAIRESLGDKAGLARSLRFIGDISNQQGNYVQALEYYKRSRTIIEALEDKDEIAKLLNNIGLVYHRQSNYASALEYFQQSLALSESLGDRAGIALTLFNIGNVHDLQGNHVQALEYFQKSLAITETLGNKDEMAHTLNSLGIVHVNQGNFAQALECYQRSLALKEAVGSKAGVAAVLNNLGMLHHQQGRYEQALEYFQKSLKLSETLGEKVEIASSLKYMGEVHRSLRNNAQALEFAEQAAAIARSIGTSETLWESLTTVGLAYRQLNRAVEARRALEEAITITETIRTQTAGGEQEQQRVFETKLFPYHAMADLLISQSKPAEALSFTERAKARVLLDVLQTGRIDVTKAMTSQEQEQERKLRAELISLNTQVTRASQQDKSDQASLGELKILREKARLSYEAFQISVYAAHPELKVQRGEAPVIKAEEINALLPDPKSALLEFIVMEDVTQLFVLIRSAGKPAVDVQVFTLAIKQADLAKQVEKFRVLLAKRDLGFRASARQLYDLLLKPAQALLRGKSNIVIVPDGKLWELPFQALVTPDRRFLIETSAISYAPSLTVLREMKAKHIKRQAETLPSTLLALGNPALGKETIERAKFVLRGGKLDPLPDAEAEVKSLGQLYTPARSKVYVGAEAREGRAKTEAGQARILHFATHGILNDASPMYSHLLFAQGDKTEDGLLEAWEMMELDLKADLAVLSGCETARGRVGAGEGMIGLSWALFVAGVPSTLVSQWKVESAATRDLMLSFHRQLSAPSSNATVTKAQALRQAMLNLMKKPQTSHPFYWAGFVLVGDGS